MAITLTQLQAATKGFINNATSADASSGETIIPAVTGKSHYIRSIVIVCISAITVTIQDNTGTPVVILGPAPFAATSSPLTVVFPDPVKVASGNLIEVDASGAGAVNVVIQGYTE